MSSVLIADETPAVAVPSLMLFISPNWPPPMFRTLSFVTSKFAVWNVLSWRAWRSEDCICSIFLVIAVMPLSAALMTLMPDAIESSRLLMSAARLFRAEAVKMLDGLCSVEFTLLPVARRDCVLFLISSVFCRLRRFARTAFEREISDMCGAFLPGNNKQRSFAVLNEDG